MKLNPKLWLFLGILLLPLMLTNQSLWLDEGCTAMYAIQSDLQSWWHYLRTDTYSDCQMPLSMLVAWITAHTFGIQEWELRAINLLWGGLTLIALFRVGKRIHLPWLPALLAIQPYFWFYTNEARPYSLEIAIGAWILAGFVEFLNSEAAGKSWAWILAATGVCLCYTTMLAPPTLGAVLLTGGLIAWKYQWKISRKSFLILAAGTIATLPAAIYYVSTLARGSGGAQIWKVDAKFFGYVIYELTGMTGIGPAVEKIRELAKSHNIHAAFAQYGPQLALTGFCFLLLGTILILGLRNRQNWNKISAGILIVVVLVSSVFLLVGLAVQKAFWARHFAPIFPFYVALLGISISGILTSRKPYAKPLILLFISLLIFSTLNLRWSDRHRKEDYRFAAQLAHQALDAKKSVWWIAAPFNAEYYQLKCAFYHPVEGKVFSPCSPCKKLSQEPPEALPVDLTKVPQPDLIILSKPDVFDSFGQIQAIIRDGGYKQSGSAQAFTFWTRQ